jgi:hypothetical protein
MGAEYTFTFENMNIERGLLWNQENAINRGIQVNQTIGKSASLSWNDGFYSNRRQSAVDRGTAAGCRAHHRQARHAVHSPSFSRRADEIEVVDARPEELHPAPGEPEPRRLGELRELALLLAADVVDEQLLGYLGAHGLAPQWGAQERILVCLTPHSDPEMLPSGRRNALRFHGALLAAHVEQGNLSPADQKLLAVQLDSARAAGAELHTLKPFRV